MVKSIGFTRLCWDCKGKKIALGGKLDKRKLWRCATCMEKMINVWKKGPPPSIGWWPTKHYHNRDSATYRWWDGECWSWAAFAHESAEKAARWAAKKETIRVYIEWADRPKDWPERSKT